MRHFARLVLFLATAVLSLAADPAQLKDVKAIFVAPIEGTDNAIAEMLHAKVISSLSKIQGITLVEDEADADALLLCTGVMQSGTTEYGHQHFLIQGGVRLVLKEGGVVLWADNISSSRFARSASTSFADNVAKGLGKLFADRQPKK
jgi:hypothetical protein